MLLREEWSGRVAIDTNLMANSSIDYYLTEQSLVGKDSNRTWRFQVNALYNRMAGSFDVKNTQLYEEKPTLVSRTSTNIQYYLLSNLFFTQDVILYGYEIFAVNSGSILLGVSFFSKLKLIH